MAATDPTTRKAIQNAAVRANDRVDAILASPPGTVPKEDVLTAAYTKMLADTAARVANKTP